jgi:thiamine-phosphate pyrophosphorylase
VIQLRILWGRAPREPALSEVEGSSQAQRGVPLNLLLYYITDRKAFAADEPTRRHRLLKKIAEAKAAGIDYIQLREKDLSARDLERLASQAVEVIADAKNLATDHRRATALLVNSRADVALAVKAAGVHLPANDLTPEEVRLCGAGTCGAGTHARELSPRSLVISISCHSPEEVAQAAAAGADLALLAPVFEKKDSPHLKAAGLSQLREACRNKIPVLALGGITLENAGSCLDAGAAGIAAIRLFQENEIAAIVSKLRR